MNVEGLTRENVASHLQVQHSAYAHCIHFDVDSRRGVLNMFGLEQGVDTVFGWSKAFLRIALSAPLFGNPTCDSSAGTSGRLC